MTHNHSACHAGTFHATRLGLVPCPAFRASVAALRFVGTIAALRRFLASLSK